MSKGRESLHAWSLAMAISSLVAMAVWLAAPAALTPAAMAAIHATWTFGAFGYLFAHIRGHRRRADGVTLVRALLCAALFTAHAFDPRPSWGKVSLAILIIVLDGVDGALARRDGPTERGAVFDMESDAFYVTTMCGVAHLYLGVTPFVFVIAAMRPLYVCVLAGLRLFGRSPSPNHAGTLRGRLVHVGLVVALIADLTPFIPVGGKDAITLIAVALVLYSYAADVARRPGRPSPRGA